MNPRTHKPVWLMPFLTLFILKQGSLNAVCSSRTRFLPLHIPGFLLNLFKKSLQGKGWVTEAATVALIFEPYEFVPAQHHGTVPCWNLKLSGIGCFEDEWEEGGNRFERLSLLNFLERNEMFLK